MADGLPTMAKGCWQFAGISQTKVPPNYGIRNGSATTGTPGRDARLLVRNLSISLDGYAAGPHQDLDHPLGIGGMQLHEWIFATRSGRQMLGDDGGNEGLDDEHFSNRGSGVGATIVAGTCSARYVDPGATASGPAGGE